MNLLLALLQSLVVLLSLLLGVAVAVFCAQIVAFPLGSRALVPSLRGPRAPLAVLVPAHDEAAVIEETIATLRPQLAAGDRLLVVADNCSDDTALLARAAGAEVTERSSELRGKGYALAHGMDCLRLSPPEVVVIVDADCQVSPGALDELAAELARSARPVQALYLMQASAGARLARRLAEFAWRVRNEVRPGGWQRLGLPCQLMGSGMAFSWAMLRDAPLANGSIVEDMKLGIDLAKQGLPPILCRAALVTSRFPDAASAATSQRTRWEHGHLEMILREVPSMTVAAARRRDGRLLGLALDLAVPPLTLLAGLLVLDAILAVCAAHGTLLAVVVLLQVVFAASVLAAWALRGRDLVKFGELLTIPWYLIAKIPLYLRFLVRRQKAWVRTDRE